MSGEVLEPRLIVFAGFAATGKSTTSKELVRRIPNAVLLDYDGINRSILTIPLDPKPRLPDFEQYVANDAVLVDEEHMVDTGYGRMLRVTPSNDCFGRHGLWQSRMVMAEIARVNLELGKVVVVDCAPIPDYQRGTLKTFLEMEGLRNYPQYLLHFVADPVDAFDRARERWDRGDINTRARDEERLSSFEKFLAFITRKQPMYPNELALYRHLLVNTSLRTPQEVAQDCLEYITSNVEPKVVIS